MSYRTLIDVDALASLQGDPRLAIVDCRFDLHDTAWGERAYAEAHNPGAVYAHLDHHLSGPTTGANGRHPLPAADALAGAFSTLGIGPGVQVVAYDQDSGMYASRLWWLLRWLGHDDVAVLDGGFATWTGAKRAPGIASGNTSGTTRNSPAKRFRNESPGPKITEGCRMVQWSAEAWSSASASPLERR